MKTQPPSRVGSTAHSVTLARRAGVTKERSFARRAGARRFAAMTDQEKMNELIRICGPSGHSAIMDATIRGDRSSVPLPDGGTQGLTPAEEFDVGLRDALRCLIGMGLLTLPSEATIDEVWDRGIPLKPEVLV